MKFDSNSPVPRFHPQEGTGLLHGFETLSRHLPASRDGDGLAQRQIQLLWGLAVALWGRLEGADESETCYTLPHLTLTLTHNTSINTCSHTHTHSTDVLLEDQTSYDHCLARRKAVSHWLREAAAPAIEREIAAAGDSVCLTLKSLLMFNLVHLTLKSLSMFEDIY